MKTLVLNLYGAPGSGKSTTAASTFSLLKLAGVNAELVTEYAKEVAWADNHSLLANQLYISAKQHNRIHRLQGKVEVIVTDSPLLQGLAYFPSHYPEMFTETIRWFNDQFHNINFLVHRVKAYNPKGRLQTESESDEKQKDIRKLLRDCGQSYYEINGDRNAATAIARSLFHHALRY